MIAHAKWLKSPPLASPSHSDDGLLAVARVLSSDSARTWEPVAPAAQRGPLLEPMQSSSRLPVACALPLGAQVSFRRDRFSPTGELGYSGIRGAEG